MLISHRKNFIFTKTVKTAGTSVESYFERYCMPEGEWGKLHARDEYISEFGIVGYRGDNSRNSIWYNHMSAAKIRKQINQVDQDIWHTYLKFTVVRNPFYKMISGFLMYEKMKQDYEQNKHNYSLTQRLKSYTKRQVLKRLHRADLIFDLAGETKIERFRSWVKKGGGVIDRDKYLINGKQCVDYFIRFEDLHQGISHVCNQLSIPFDSSQLPEFKKGRRDNKTPVEDYYDRETEMIVRKLYAWEIKRFGYDFPSI